LRKRLAIVGGGVHGSLIAVAACSRHGYDPWDISIVDESTALMSSWRRVTSSLRMRHLRSGILQGMGDASSLLRFARTEGKKLAFYASPFRRPSLDLFNSHCDVEIRRSKVSKCVVAARCTGLRRLSTGWEILCGDGQGIQADRVILALGRGSLRWPRGGEGLSSDGAPAWHALGGRIPWERIPDARVVVVGGGTTGAHLVSEIARVSGEPPTIVTRRELRESWFDAAPEWASSRRVDRLLEKTSEERDRMVMAESRQGTCPPDQAEWVRKAVASGRIRHRIVPNAVLESAGGGIRIGGQDYDLAVCATGYRCLSGGDLLLRIGESLGLPVLSGGRPRLDARLSWAPGLHVSGQGAMSVVGPLAANIAGARLAADRIFQ
jgi:hypothetical protein